MWYNEDTVKGTTQPTQKGSGKPTNRRKGEITMNGKYIKSAMKLAVDLAVEVTEKPALEPKRGCRIDGALAWYNTETYAFAIPSNAMVTCSSFNTRGVPLTGFDRATESLKVTNTTIKDGKRMLRALISVHGTPAYVNEKFLKVFLSDASFEYRTHFHRGKPQAIGVFDNEQLIGIVMPVMYNNPYFE